jgi:DeoR/GlpR family transcriptional regulator of sugar metabolism
MLAEDRQKTIKKMIQEKGSITVNEVIQQLNISKPTLWRDLNILSKNGIISKTHGGAVLREAQDSEFRFTHRMGKNIQVKKKIAQKAASLVSPGDIIGIDTGTTATLFASFLKSKEDITVVTPSLSAAQELMGAKGVYVVLLGGDVKEESMSVTGSITLQNISQFHINQFFIGAIAFDPVYGTQDAYLFEVEIKKALCRISEKKIVLIDSSKFGKSSLASAIEMKEINTIITDHHIQENHEKQIRDAGVEIIKV